MMRLNGYSTGAFGKWHETAAWETSVSGPFDRWPTHSGFDKFYGFIGGETDQWYPLVYDGVTRVNPPHVPGYHFTDDMTDQGDWLDEGAAVYDARQALLYVLCNRRSPRAAPCA
jgi:arylsulfatase